MASLSPSDLTSSAQGSPMWWRSVKWWEEESSGVCRRQGDLTLVRYAVYVRKFPLRGRWITATACNSEVVRLAPSDAGPPSKARYLLSWGMHSQPRKPVHEWQVSPVHLRD